MLPWLANSSCLKHSRTIRVAAETLLFHMCSDYLTAYDGEMLLMRSQNKPVVIYTYKMQFSKALLSYAISI